MIIVCRPNKFKWFWYKQLIIIWSWHLCVVYSKISGIGWKGSQCISVCCKFITFEYIPHILWNNQNYELSLYEDHFPLQCIPELYTILSRKYHDQLSIILERPACRHVHSLVPACILIAKCCFNPLYISDSRAVAGWRLLPISPLWFSTKALRPTFLNIWGNVLGVSYDDLQVFSTLNQL